MKRKRWGLWKGSNDNKEGLFFKEDPFMDGIVILLISIFLTGFMIGLGLGTVVSITVKCSL